ncbi:MAG: MBL fold metallo-hydrolase [Chloroflexi bacterium]|nr:MBL fold metallo-hydrolase [Chloroflexota bacterium]
MKIKWLGHSCFLLTSANGLRLLTDPFNEKVRFPLPEVEADVVTVSHQHFDHNNTSIVRGSPKIFSVLGQYEYRNLRLLGVPSFHDRTGGSERGRNIIFKITMDGLNIVHCGDLGHILHEKTIKEIGAVDVLLVPVGGYYTIDASDAALVVKQLRPKVTIPMHFKTGELDFPIDTVDRFIKEVGEAKEVDGQEIELTRDNIEEMAGVHVLKAPEFPKKTDEQASEPPSGEKKAVETPGD